MPKPLIVSDGDTIVVFVKMPPTAQDPCNEVPALVQAYRVVAEKSTPVLKLVELSAVPKKVTEDEYYQVLENQ